MDKEKISPHLSELLKRMRIQSDTLKDLTEKVFEKAVEEDRVRKDKKRNIVIVTTKTRSSKLWMELLGNDDFKIGKKKKNLRLRLEALNGEEDIVPEFDPGEGPSGLSVGRGPVDWARDKLRCCREDAILLVSAKEVTFTICAFHMIFMEEASGGLEIPALKEVGFPGVGMFFRFGNSIFLQLKIGDTVPAMSAKEVPVNPDWEEPYILIMTCKGITWEYAASNRDHLILLGPREVHQGILSGKPSLWKKARADLWKKKHSI